MKLKEAYMVGVKRAYASVYEARALMVSNLKQAFYYKCRAALEFDTKKSEMNPLERLACYVGQFNAIERILDKGLVPQAVMQRVMQSYRR